VGAHGSLLGVLSDPVLEERAVLLAPGETLVFFTDGVIERHGDDAPFGEDGLAALLARNTGGDVQGLVAAVAHAATSNRRTLDDIAMLAIRATA
jgi:serine phosphatase RsbU (regulator of sigma subunit)